MNDDMRDLVAADAAQEGSSEQIDRLLGQFIEIDGEVQTLEAAIKLAKEARTKLQMELIPAAMEVARKKKISYADGAVLSLRAYLEASLPSLSAIADAPDDEQKAELELRRLQGLAWLRDNQGSSIIKNELVVAIPKGKDNVVAELTELCDRLELTWSRGENVHHMTLKSFLKEKLKSGANIPIELFKLVTGQKAHYKPAKEN